MGHVNNANHITYFEIARVKYFNDVVGEEVDWSRQGIILAKIQIEYKEPVLFRDDLFVYTTCSRIGTKSFDFSYSIVKIKDGKEIELSKGFSVQVCYDYAEKRTINMPEGWKRKVEQFEK